MLLKLLIVKSVGTNSGCPISTHVSYDMIVVSDPESMKTGIVIEALCETRVVSIQNGSINLNNFYGFFA